MRTIRAIFSAGQLRPLDPLDLPENTPLTIALLDGDDLPPVGIAGVAHAAGAFAFLDDPREDIYSQTDGEGV